MSHTLSIGPAKLPIDLNIAKTHLRVEDDDTADDALIIDLIDVAAAECERWTKRALITQTWQLFLDGWPRSREADVWWDGVRTGSRAILDGDGGQIELPRPPVQSVTLIRAFDDDDTATTFAASNYFVDTASEPGRVLLRKGVAAPVIERVANGLEILYVAGYGDDFADVPSPLRQGMLSMIAHLYENRGDDPGEAAKVSGAHNLWRRYQIRSI